MKVKRREIFPPLFWQIHIYKIMARVIISRIFS